MAARRRGAPRRGEHRAARDAEYFARRRRPAHDLQLLGEPAPLPRARHAGTRGRSRRALRADRRIPGASQWAHFLRNHDELDLGRLSRRGARAACSSGSARSPSMQLYDRGIRRRPRPDARMTAGGSSSPTACCSRCRARRCSATATRSAWATTSALKERNAIRTPMQWSAGANAGFSTAASRPTPSSLPALRLPGRQRGDSGARPTSLLRWLTR